MDDGRMELVLQKSTSGAVPILLDSTTGQAGPGREIEERLRHIAAGSRSVSGCHAVEAQLADAELDRAIAATHAEGYLTFLRQRSAELEGGAVDFDHSFTAPGVEQDTPVVAGSWELARESARAALWAAERVAGGSRMAYALCRPPGHHAGVDFLGGYCFLNNAVLAARHLLDRGLERVGLLDVDAHFGNGSSAMAAEVPGLFFGSYHPSTLESFPYRPTEPAPPRQRFEVLDDPGEAELLAATDRLIEAATDFGAQALVISVGYDIVDGDPHGHWHLPVSVFEPLGARLRAAGLPLCLVQEGGYLLEALEESARLFAEGLLSAPA